MTAKTLRWLLPGVGIVLLLGFLMAGETMADQWRAELREIDQKLHAKEWGAAEKQAWKLAVKIADEGGTGDEFSYNLAAATALRAIAEAGLGRKDDAAWHWDTALNLFPDIGKTDVSPYGPAAEELRFRTLRDPEAEEAVRNRLEALRAVWGAEGKEVVPPRILKQPRPHFPKALAALGTNGILVVEVIIGEDGRVRAPLVLDLQGGGPAMKYVALDSLREWRFEPAKLDGKAVKVYYVLTVNFTH
ncbi:MAG TPA: energy transducer TonB [Thermoanaerobaculia bacterium]|jgi:hypothetical protein